MLSSVRYGDRAIEYTLATNPALDGKIRVHVHPNGTVEVEAPPDTPQPRVRASILKRARWIDRNLEQFEKMREHALPRQYVSGETHFYLGRRYQLKVIEDGRKRSSVKLRGSRIEVSLPCADRAAVKRRLNAWYRLRGQSYLEGRP